MSQTLIFCGGPQLRVNILKIFGNPCFRLLVVNLPLSSLHHKPKLKTKRPSTTRTEVRQIVRSNHRLTVRVITNKLDMNRDSV